jgi:hypothetical protein
VCFGFTPAGHWPGCDFRAMNNCLSPCFFQQILLERHYERQEKNAKKPGLERKTLMFSLSVNLQV